MALFIHGVTVTLLERRETGRDAFGAPVFEETAVPVDNVLVQPVESTVNPPISATDLSAKVEAYTLAIPKGDSHTWEDREVLIFGQRYRTESYSWQGIEAMIPLDWNRKVVARRFG